ncbi:alpha-1,2-fucosyltransferase [Pectinatus frisingensis]|uniref:alpha-1,2-fucosyltransferase n=1 Tax=Pectinatus frisingensis TaxID=865 RepID=UPI0018C5BAF4|nr:alpha-1,2-fucosyltransferase [Pectinatus frisingensis]
MIVTELNGGLGNQMFQYAIGRNLAIKNQTELRLDISTFDEYKLRKYELYHFNIEEKFINKKNISNLKNTYGLRYKWARIKNRIFHDITGVREKNYMFDSHILSLKNNVYLQGYWQSEKYFKEIEDVIRKDFCIKTFLSKKNQIMASLIKNEECPVSLHIRRGDYISDPKTNAFHGICSMDYYVKCINILKEKFNNISVFVFSDDFLWTRENLKLDLPIYWMENSGEKYAFEDMYLMSLCHHHIIANSSFSWWGAWLDDSGEKIVFAPKKWFNNESNNIKDLIPNNWILI